MASTCVAIALERGRLPDYAHSNLTHSLRPRANGWTRIHGCSIVTGPLQSCGGPSCHAFTKPSHTPGTMRPSGPQPALGRRAVRSRRCLRQQVILVVPAQTRPADTSYTGLKSRPSRLQRHDFFIMSTRAKPVSHWQKGPEALPHLPAAPPRRQALGPRARGARGRSQGHAATGARARRRERLAVRAQLRGQRGRRVLEQLRRHTRARL
jgi:hypothetical protein